MKTQHAIWSRSRGRWRETITVTSVSPKLGLVPLCHIPSAPKNFSPLLVPMSLAAYLFHIVPLDRLSARWGPVPPSLGTTELHDVGQKITE